jgi:hypothetical protein
MTGCCGAPLANCAPAALPKLPPLSSLAPMLFPLSSRVPTLFPLSSLVPMLFPLSSLVPMLFPLSSRVPTLFPLSSLVEVLPLTCEAGLLTGEPVGEGVVEMSCGLRAVGETWD